MRSQNIISKNRAKRVYSIIILLSLMVLCNVVVVAQTIPATNKIPTQTKIINGYDPDKGYVIFKADSDEEIDKLKSKIKADGGNITISNLKRNKEGQITSISLEYTVDNKSIAKGVYNNEDLNSIHFGTTIDGSVTISKFDNTGKWLKSKEPLVYIDGKKASKTDMYNIHPNKMGTINVWKGEKALEKFGENAVDGVIEVTTKGD